MPTPLFQSSLLRLGAPLSKCPSESQRSRCIAEKSGVFKHNISDSSFSSNFSYSFSYFFLALFFFGNQSGMVAWTYL